MTKARIFFMLTITLAAMITLTACEKSIAPPGITKFVQTDTLIGGGTEAKTGMKVTVHYTGWLYDETLADKKGTQFDSSHNRNKPFDFTLGAGRVIKGWDQGVAGMKVGGKRTLMIPPQLGYGSRGAGSAIPANASLLFEVELVAVGE